MRVPYRTTTNAAPLCVFTTRSPDTGATVAADSLPTAVIRDPVTPFSALASGAQLTVAAIETGVYIVTWGVGETAASLGFAPGQMLTLVVSATVGGITQKLVETIEFGPAVLSGIVDTDGANTATTFRVGLADWQGLPVTPADNAFVGSLVAFDGSQEVRRITALTETAGVVRITLDSALSSGTPTTGDVFWVTTI